VGSKVLPPVFLTVVALAQIGLVRTMELTAWKGGGFGMFATLDHGAYRGVDILVDAPERSEHLAIPPSLEVPAARAAACPAEWLLRRLAEGVVARERRYERPVSRVTLTVWRADFDRATLRPSERHVRTFVFDVPSER
jgi:hypothetical protein